MPTVFGAKQDIKLLKTELSVELISVISLVT